MADLKPSTGTLSLGTGTEDSQGSEETAAELTPTPGVPPGGATQPLTGGHPSPAAVTDTTRGTPSPP